MRVLVVASTFSELKPIREGIKSAGIKEKLDIDYLCCGIGNYETISSLEHYLTENREPVFIWNIGICGYWNSKEEKKFDPIQVSSVINVHTQKELIIPPFLQIASLKNCFCSESIINEIPDFGNKIGIIEDEMYFDMESRGIEFVASKYKYPRLILKVPFNFVGNGRLEIEKDYWQPSCEVVGVLKTLRYSYYLEGILGWMKLYEEF